VQPDHRDIGRQSIDYLIAAGARRPVCLTNSSHPNRSEYYAERADAFRQFAAMHGLVPVLIGADTPPRLDEAGKARQARDTVAEALALRPRVDGIFVANGLGHYVHGELLREGIRPMDDIPLVAGDLEVMSRHLDPPPVTIDIHSAVLGRLAVELLLTRLSHPEAPRVRQLVSADLVVP
jgi:DNA-binding LacI/PurR family transcriptional regulator